MISIREALALLRTGAICRVEWVNYDASRPNKSGKISAYAVKMLRKDNPDSPVFEENTEGFRDVRFGMSDVGENVAEKPKTQNAKHETLIKVRVMQDSEQTAIIRAFNYPLLVKFNDKIVIP